MRVLITGGAGFIGSTFARFLKEKYPLYELHIIDNLSKGNVENIPDQVRFIECDTSDKNCLPIEGSYDYILHFAGQSSGERSFEDQLMDARSNYLSTVNIVDYANNHKCNNLIFASSMSVYGDNKQGPKTPYGLNKLHSENYIKTFFKGSYKILRLNNIYGPGQDLKDMKQGMVSIFLSQALESNKIVVKGALSRVRDFVWIQDLVNLLDYYLHSSDFENSKSEIVDVASGRLTSVKELLDEIQQVLGLRQIQVIGGTMGDQSTVQLHSDTFKSVLNYSATSIKKGMKTWISQLNQY